MKKLLLLIFILLSSICMGQYRFQFADSAGVLREVSYKYPLPIELKETDTTKAFQYNNGVINNSFPMKLYNFVKEVQEFYIKQGDKS